MTFSELDACIRKALPDGVDRRIILTEIHDMNEAMNSFLGYFLSITGHKWDEDSESWRKEDQSYKRNVNAKL